MVRQISASSNAGAGSQHQPTVTPISLPNYVAANDDYTNAELFYPSYPEYVGGVARPFSASSTSTNTSSSNDSCSSSSNLLVDNHQMLPCSFQTSAAAAASVAPQSHQDHQFQPSAAYHHQSNHFSAAQSQLPGYTSVIVDAQQCVHSYVR